MLFIRLNQRILPAGGKNHYLDIRIGLQALQDIIVESDALLGTSWNFVEVATGIRQWRAGTLRSLNEVVPCLMRPFTKRRSNGSGMTVAPYGHCGPARIFNACRAGVGTRHRVTDETGIFRRRLQLLLYRRKRRSPNAMP